MSTLKQLTARLFAIIERRDGKFVNFANLNDFYPSIDKAPAYPKDFERVLKKNNKVKNGEVLFGLRQREPGEWKKVYYDGYLNNRKISIHYFESKSGQVCDVKVVYDKWSNENTRRQKC